jgi:hypothetical protein
VARIRTVKPDAWHDGRLATVSRDARLLWTVLLTMSDDEGRFRAVAAIIFGHGYPHDLEALRLIPGWLDELDGAGLIRVYEVQGSRYGCFPTWANHQKVGKPTPSKLPPSPSSLGSHGKPGEPQGIRPAEVEVEVEVEVEGANAPVADSRDAITEVWKHYLAAVQGDRRGPLPSLNDNRRRMIRTALKVREMVVVLDAITGLSRSPHHNGENPQRTKYLDLRYALRGNGQRGESDEERIDRMAALAQGPVAVSGSRQQSGVDDLIARHLRGAQTDNVVEGSEVA